MPFSPSYRKNPLLRILYAFLIGILIISLVPLELRLKLVGVISALVLITLVFFIILSKYSGAFPGILLLLIVMLCGMVLLKQAQEHTQLPDEKLKYRSIAMSLPVKGANSTRIDCRLLSVEIGGEFQAANEKVRIFMRDDSALQNIQIGDSLNFSGHFQFTPNSANPQSFRYDKYLQNRGVWYTAFLSAGDYSLGGYSGKMILRRKAAIIQSAIVSSFSSYGIEGEELAIISALVAGERSQINEALRDEYAIAGAMHILAVSGLHVGILYLFLQLLLFKRNELPFYRYSRLLIVIAILWAYAFVAGLSPSVIRATLMFSLFQAGKSFNRPAHNLNILAASALILLSLNPLLLFQLGFQFSYLAVLGIIIFQPVLEKLIVFKRALPDRIWQLLTVSISVQFTTFPLALYYFNQFPSYFLLTNIVVIPLVWTIMMMSVLFFAVMPFSLIVPVVAKTLNVLLFAMNYSIEWIANLPFALIPDIRFSHLHMSAWYSIVLMSMFINVRMKANLFFRAALVSLCILMVSDIVAYVRQESRSEMLIYNSNQNLILSFINGHQHLLLVEMNDENRLERDLQNLKKLWLNRQIYRSRKLIVLDSLSNGTILCGDFVEIKNYTEVTSILFADKNYYYLRDYAFDYSEKDLPQQIEGLIIGKHSPFPDEQLFNAREITKLIICNSAYYSSRIRWLSFAKEKGIECIDIADEGAFQVSSRDISFN